MKPNLSIEVKGAVIPEFEEIFTTEALDFLVELHTRFNDRRLHRLRQRKLRTGMPHFLAETAHLRADPSWKVAPIPPILNHREVEITGPTFRKMIITALNSGANIFMADFEDANSPTWNNMVRGQLNVRETVKGSVEFTSPEGKEYRLKEDHALLFMRPRGWHLNEKHLLIGGEEISGSLFDFGLFCYHNASTLAAAGKGPFFYLPKLESHLEARLWNEVFLFTQERLGIPRGTFKATILIETYPAAFEMEEMLYELREHSAGLNAGRWDYLFSIIKQLHHQKGFVLPERGQLTMTAPFMEAYSRLVVQTCVKRGAQPIGGMSAFVPSRKKPEINEQAFERVREDKALLLAQGFVGTWVAHPDLVPISQEVFNGEEVFPPTSAPVTEKELMNFHIEGGKITEKGLRQNLNVALQYLASWLSGTGAVALFNLMEDAATAEICRSQVWQWLHHGGILDDGRLITRDLIAQCLTEEEEQIGTLYGSHLSTAKNHLENLIYSPEFEDFLTLKLYPNLED